VHVADRSYIRTPLPIERSEQDYRAPIEQAEQFFWALRLQKKKRWCSSAGRAKATTFRAAASRAMGVLQ
jgi:hypothetical protein